MNRVPETTDARPTTPDRILVVEDSPEDAEAIERALRRTHPDLALEFADRGRAWWRRCSPARTSPA